MMRGCLLFLALASVVCWGDGAGSSPDAAVAAVQPTIAYPEARPAFAPPATSAWVAWPIRPAPTPRSGARFGEISPDRAADGPLAVPFARRAAVQLVVARAVRAVERAVASPLARGRAGRLSAPPTGPPFLLFV